MAVEAAADCRDFCCRKERNEEEDEEEEERLSLGKMSTIQTSAASAVRRRRTEKRATGCHEGAAEEGKCGDAMAHDQCQPSSGMQDR